MNRGPGDTLIVLFGWRNMTPHHVLHRLFLFCMVHSKSLLYLPMTASNTGCTWFTHCPWGILYTCKVWNRYSYLLKNYDMLEITRNPDKARPRKPKTRHSGTQQEGVPWLWKILQAQCKMNHGQRGLVLQLNGSIYKHAKDIIQITATLWLNIT